MIEISQEAVEASDKCIDAAIAAAAQATGFEATLRFRDVGVLTAEAAFLHMAGLPAAIIQPTAARIALKLASNAAMNIDAAGTMSPIAAVAVAAEAADAFRVRMEQLLGTSHGGFAHG